MIDADTAEQVSGLLITCNPTAESHPSNCGTVAFANPGSVSQAYHVHAGQGQFCGSGPIGTWSASGNITLPPGGGDITVQELFDTVTVQSAG